MSIAGSCNGLLECCEAVESFEDGAAGFSRGSAVPCWNSFNKWDNDFQRDIVVDRCFGDFFFGLVGVRG